jgi:tetratricopeptide (TPR) repeat protein
MFAPHPELTGLIVTWFDTTLLKTPGRAPANPAPVSQQTTILETIDEPGGATKAADMLAQARKRDPTAILFSEGIVNLIGYEHLQDGDAKGAIEILKLNATAFPNSANTYDSLSEALAADGQSELAIQNAEKALKLLESDTTSSEERRKGIRESAEQRLKQLKTASK